ncbi:MAG: hypothetical protein K0U98_04075 [Deltaproteobacteria bacterium]|nr:hypothetical protein [Deltaproteobacteria bacterium]
MSGATTELTLERFCSSQQMGTFGTITVGGATVYTLEPPWRGNAPRVSCIPSGRYRCVPRR